MESNRCWMIESVFTAVISKASSHSAIVYPLTSVSRSIPPSLFLLSSSTFFSSFCWPALHIFFLPLHLLLLHILFLLPGMQNSWGLRNSFSLSFNKCVYSNSLSFQLLMPLNADVSDIVWPREFWEQKPNQGQEKWRRRMGIWVFVLIAGLAKEWKYVPT